MEQETKRPTDPAGNPIFRIPEQNLAGLQARIEKLNRRAKRLGMEPLVLAETGDVFEMRKRQVPGFDFEDGHPKFIEYQVRFVLVTLTGSCPHINGWTFAATINHEEGGNILRVAPDFDLTLPVEYRTATTACEHCHTDRRRNDTYVLHGEAGEWKQVGRNCLADFLRCASPAGLAEWAEVVASLGDEAAMYEEEGMGGGYAPTYYGMLDLLAQVSCCVRRDGWCSRTEARNSYHHKMASVDQATCWFEPKYIREQSAADREKYTPSQEDKDRAAAGIAWAQELPGDVTNDYLWNVRVVSHKEAVKGRDAGLAASIIVAYQKHLERELARKYENDHPSEFFGTPGKREVFTLTVVGFKELESDWGMTTMVQFRDAIGNRAVWFASNPGIPLDLDEPLVVKATVKAHETYREKKQTVLSRVIPYEPKGAKQPKAEQCASC